MSLTCGSGSVERGRASLDICLSPLWQSGRARLPDCHLAGEEPGAMRYVNTDMHNINGPLLMIEEHSKLRISNALYQKSGDTAMF